MLSKVAAILGCCLLLACSPEQSVQQSGNHESASSDSELSLTDKAVALSKKKEFTQAAELFRQAADDGDRQAMYLLGLLYARGDGVGQDFIQAHDWLYKASMGGHPKAMYHLGEMYARGDGVEENPVDALTWFWVATTAGERYAEKRLRAIAPRLTPEQMTQAERNSRALWKKIPHDLNIKRFSLH